MSPSPYIPTPHTCVICVVLPDPVSPMTTSTYKCENVRRGLGLRWRLVWPLRQTPLHIMALILPPHTCCHCRIGPISMTVASGRL